MHPFRLHKLLLVLALLLSSAVHADIPQDATWIDTRSHSEYVEGHLPNAEHIPFDAIEAGVVQLGLASDAPIYLYCASGRRAETARQALLRKGYTRVTNVGGLDNALQLTGQQAVR